MGRSCAAAKASRRSSTTRGGSESRPPAVSPLAARARSRASSLAGLDPAGANVLAPSLRPSAAHARRPEGSDRISSPPSFRAAARRTRSDASAAADSSGHRVARRRNPGSRFARPGWFAAGVASLTSVKTLATSAAIAPRASAFTPHSRSSNPPPPPSFLASTSAPRRSLAVPSESRRRTYGSHTCAATTTTPSPLSLRSPTATSCVFFAPSHTRTPPGCACAIRLRPHTFPAARVVASETRSTASLTSFSSSPVSNTIVALASAMTRYAWCASSSSASSASAAVKSSTSTSAALAATSRTLPAFSSKSWTS